MSNNKYEATFHPNGPFDTLPPRGIGGPSYQPLPRRTPMEALADHGAPPPDPAVDRMAYRNPGRAPWVKRRLPAWAWVSMILGGLLIVCGSSAAVALFDQTGPVPGISLAPAEVVVTGTCEKKLVGEYGLVASVRATNSTDEAQTGVIWVRWPVTGEASSEFVKRVTLAPGQAADLPVNQEVPAERWYRTGACSFGWTGS